MRLCSLSVKERPASTATSGHHVVQIDNGVFRSYAVHASETLDETDRVPV